MFMNLFAAIGLLFGANNGSIHDAWTDWIREHKAPPIVEETTEVAQGPETVEALEEKNEEN